MQAVASDRFVDSIGINTHLTYTNTTYSSQWPQVLAALKGLGVRHIRDGYHDWPAGDPMYAKHQQLAAEGIGCDFVVPIGSSVGANEVKDFGQMAGDVDSLEAPNECDANGGQNCGGERWLTNLEAFLPEVAEAGKTLGVPVLGPSFTLRDSYPEIGNIAKEMTKNNLHVYFGGRNPESRGWGAIDAEGNGYGSFAWWLDNAQIDGPGLKSVITESGYIVKPTVTPFAVSQAVEAKYVPRTLLTAFQRGIERTYLYELLDDISSPDYGLMNAQLQPKAGYTALASLIALTADPGAPFTPGELEYQISGSSADLQQLLLQKRDGSFLLVLWLGDSGYDPVSTLAEPVAAETITLQLAGDAYAQKLDQFGETGAVSSKTLKAAQSETIAVSDSILIVEIGGAGPS